MEFYDYIPRGKLQNGRMRLVMKDVDTTFINSIGRIMMNHVPTYAFARELIRINKINEGSGYTDSEAINHSMITLAVSNIRIPNIDSELFYLEEKYWKDVDYLDSKRERHEKEKNVEANLNVENSTEDNILVTANDMKVYVEGKKVNLFDPDYPPVITVLKPQEALCFDARAVLGVGMQRTIWEGAANFSIDSDLVPGQNVFAFHPSPHVDAFKLMDKALAYFKERARIVINSIKEKHKKEEECKQFVAVITGEDQTIGNPLVFEFQLNDKTATSSCVKPNHLVDKINISIVAKAKEDIGNILEEGYASLNRKIETLQNDLKGIEKKMRPVYFDADGISKFYHHKYLQQSDPSKIKIKS